MKIIAFDIGGTDVKYGVCENGVLTNGSFPVRGGEGDAPLPERIKEFVESNAPDKVAVCSPGPFDFKNGISLAEHKLAELYHVNLGDIIKSAGVSDVFFVSDSGAFLLGMLSLYPEARHGRACGVTIGTGLGYISSIEGKLWVDETEKPKNSLWCAPWENGICEEFVSATAIRKKAAEIGFENMSVRKLSFLAKGGNEKLLRLFNKMGEDLGKILTERSKLDGYTYIFLGGNVTRSWELFKNGFEKYCTIHYTIADNPDTAALHGLLWASEIGKDNIYIY